MRWPLTLVLGVLPVVLPLPGGGSGRVDERAREAGRFRSTVTFVDATDDGGEGGLRLAFPQFLKRKAKAFAPTLATRPPASDVHELLLTFDDGPDLATTPLVLSELERRGLKAIFFVNGKGLMGSRPTDRARRHLLRKIAAHGHYVGNHSLTHKKLCLDPASIAQEIDANAEIIAAVTGVYPRLFRSPYGGTCQTLEMALAERSMINVGWNIDPQEWRGDDADAAVPAVLAQLDRLSGRGILLLHDTERSTPRALPRILDWIEARNRSAQTNGRTPFRIVDYTLLLPPRPIAPTGMEAIVAASVAGFGVLQPTQQRAALAGR